jgi:hypothetical protein
MTPAQIIADCDEHDLHITIGRVPGTGANKWAVRIGLDLRKMRLAATFDAAVLAAWAAYTNSEVA